jgi:hypothetical protein
MGSDRQEIGADEDDRMRRISSLERSKIDTPGSGVPPIFEWQIASYERPPSGEGFENLFAEIGADSRA